ncbi:MAG: ribosome small subunit-dependent GTPase A [Bacteroidota bacterium]
MHYGTVIKSTGSWYQVRLETADRELVNARMSGRFRQDDLPLTNPIAVGDRVGLAIETSGDERTAAIKKIDPRTNYVVRQSPRRKHDLHLLASNIDQAVLITTIKEPELKLGFVDRFLLMTEPFNIPTILVINKQDLLDQDGMEIYEGLAGLYESIGYEVILVSAETGSGITEFSELLRGKRSLLSGQSGVGKSSLINTIEPQLSLRTGELSDYSGKGQHTTTFAELFELSFGGELIDTPGIKTLSFNYLEPIDVAHNFREIFALSTECKFGGSCLHRTEPACAVRKSVEEEDGQVSELRYQSYLTLLEEVESQNYWERKKV